MANKPKMQIGDIALYVNKTTEAFLFHPEKGVWLALVYKDGQKHYGLANNLYRSFMIKHGKIYKPFDQDHALRMKAILNS